MRPPYRLVYLAVCLVAMVTGCLTDDDNTTPPPADDDDQGEIGEPDRVPIDPKTDAPDPDDQGCARIADDNDCTP